MMTSFADDRAGFAVGAETGARTIAFEWARYVATVALRLSAFVILPALFWSSIAAIIY